MSVRTDHGSGQEREPTRAELTAIEREWPRIVMDLLALEIEILMITAEDAAGVTL
ncbi:DUF6284 family protein [Parafrankia sp. FMc6]|uniref:DUF6284 family protein n=1 Tax=Parafrankia soli TaxID=2599596 RepID=UPI0034D5B96E